VVALAAARGLILVDLGDGGHALVEAEERLARQAGWDTAVLYPGALGPVLEVPRPATEPPSAEAAAALCVPLRCRALIVSGVDTAGVGLAEGDALTSAWAPLAVAHAQLTAPVIQVRADDGIERGTAVLHVKRTVPEALGTLWPPGSIELSWQAPPPPNLMWEMAPPMAVLRAHPLDLWHLVAARGPEPPPPVAGLALEAFLARRFGERIAVAAAAPETPVYVQPSESELRFLDAQLAAPLAARAPDGLDDADRRRLLDGLASLVGYRVHELTDCAGPGVACWVLAEAEPARLGWGTLAVLAEHGAPIAVEVPRPLREAGTWRLGVELWQTLGARAVVVAAREARLEGADPASADTTRHPFEAFHEALHGALVEEGTPLLLQIRGFGVQQPVAEELVVALGRPLLPGRRAQAVPLDPPWIRLAAALDPAGPLGWLTGKVRYHDGGKDLLELSGIGNPQLSVFGAGGRPGLRAALVLRPGARRLRRPPVRARGAALRRRRAAAPRRARLEGAGRASAGAAAAHAVAAAAARVGELVALARRYAAEENLHVLRALGRAGVRHRRLQRGAAPPLAAHRGQRRARGGRARWCCSPAAEREDVSPLRRRQGPGAPGAVRALPPPARAAASTGASAMRRLLPLAGLALAFLLLGGITLRTLRAVEAPSDPAERKLAEAKRYLYYIVTRSEGPEFQLAGHERDLYIVSHGVLPGAPPFDPARQLTYGLRLSALLDGKEVWARELYTRSRQSKARRAGGVWLDEAAFSLERGVEVTDDRLLVARLPDDLPAGAVLRFRLAGDSDGEALVRVYERTPRAARRASSSGCAASPRRSARSWPRRSPSRPGTVSTAPSAPRACARGGCACRRSAARGRATAPAPSMSRTSACRSTSQETSRRRDDGNQGQPGALRGAQHRRSRRAASGRRARPGRSAQPGAGGARDPLDRRGRPAAAAGLAGATGADRGDADGERARRPAQPAPPHRRARRRARCPHRAGRLAGAARRAGDAGGRGAALAPRGAPLGHGPGEGHAAPGALGPRRRAHRAHRARRRAALARGGAAGEPGRRRAHRRDLRPRGQAAHRQEVQLASQVSRFEEVRRWGRLARPVAEPASFRLIAPAGARRIVVQAAQPTFVRAHALATLSPEPDALEAPFDAVQLQSTVWRHAPLDERSWLPLQPLNRAALADREARLAAQVRLEPAPEATAAAGGAATTLAPDGETERQVILEKADGWEDGHQLRLRPAARCG
jgi:hypothetical protein